MKELGYGRDYRYAHSEPDAFVPDRNLPDALGDRVFYEPSERGAEADLAERLRTWRQRRHSQTEKEGTDGTVPSVPFTGGGVSGEEQLGTEGTVPSVPLLSLAA